MEYVKLGNIVDYRKGYAFKSSLYTDTGIMVVRVSDFTIDSISENDAVYIEEDKAYDKHLLQYGDILIQTVGSWANNPNSIVGKVVRVPKLSTRAYLNQNIVKLIPRESIDYTYLFYSLKANRFSLYCVNRGQGAANQASITLETILRFKFLVHSTKEQRRIASILSAYDNLIENNNKRIRLLEQMAENLYKEWFVRFRFPGHENAEFENGLPKGWGIERIGNVCETIGGGTPSTGNPAYWDGDIKWVTPSDITSKNSLPLLKVEGRISEEGLKKSSAKLLPPYTILMTSRASIGYFGIAPFEVCTNQGFISIISQKDNLRMYMLYMLKTRKDEIVANANGATFLEISKGRFRKMKMLLPTDSVLESFEDKTMIIFNAILKLEKQNENLSRQRDLLLPRLMSGKLEVKV